MARYAGFTAGGGDRVRGGSAKRRPLGRKNFVARTPAIYDPRSVAPASTAGRFIRTLFPNNIMPPSYLDPMAQKILSYFALPNATTTADGKNNYTDPQPRTIDYHCNIVRIDHSIGQNHRLYGTFTTSFLHEINRLAFHNEVLGNNRNRFHHGPGLGGVFILRPNLVADVRYGITRYIQWDRPPSLGYNLASLGFPSSLTQALDPSLTSSPEIAIAQYSNIGSASGSGSRPATLYHTVSAMLSQQRGNHALPIVCADAWVKSSRGAPYDRSLRIWIGLRPLGAG